MVPQGSLTLFQDGWPAQNLYRYVYGCRYKVVGKYTGTGVVSWQILAKPCKMFCMDSNQHRFFARFDEDAGGTLDRAEFKNVLRLGLRLTVEEISDKDIMLLAKCLDNDEEGEEGAGELQIEEIAAFIEHGSASFNEVAIKALSSLECHQVTFFTPIPMPSFCWHGLLPSLLLPLALQLLLSSPAIVTAPAEH